MTSRQRMLDAFNFNSPDRIPVVYHPSPAGLYVHGQKLLDLFKTYPPDNPMDFVTLPAPPPGTIDHKGRYHEIRTDAWGTEWQYLIFGVWGHPQNYPFQTWHDAKKWQFPSLTTIEEVRVTAQAREYLVFSGTISLFERLHALRPMDDVLVDIISQDPDLMEFLDRLVDYWLKAIDEMINAGADVIMFGDDWGTQDAPLISPALFKQIFKPRYKKLMEPIHAAGKKVFFHCCGFMGYLFDELIELGIHGLWPQIKLFEANPEFLEKCRQHRVTLYIHPDRQWLIPKGSPTEIEAAIKQYAAQYHGQGGGGIFYIEIENDAPFENVKALIEAVDKWR